MSWRPIDSAPRNGSAILLYTPAKAWPGRQSDMEKVPGIQPGYWRIEYGRGWWQTDLWDWDAGEWGGPLPIELSPTHWAPIPELPPSALSILG